MPMVELAALLTGATARNALARRDITAVFGILRDAGVSQLRIAAATGQRQSEVSEIVSGRQVQSVALLERVADGLGVPRGWMGLAYGLGSEPEPTAPQDVLSTEEEIRANLLRHGGTALFGRPVFGPAASIRVPDTPAPVPRRIGPPDVGHVAGTTERLSRLVSDFGGIPMTDALTAHARVSEALLGATMRDPVRQQLLVALSDAHRTAGSAAAGAGLRELARQHFVRGMDCAGAGGDLRRAVVNLGYLGSLELRVGPNEALKFFQLGAATAPTRLTRAALEYRCAWALGLLDGAADALRELRRAAESFEAAREEPRPWEHFATALPHVEGCTYFALRRFDRAAVAFAAAAEETSHAVVCTVSNSGLLAAAQLRCGELRSGLATAEGVITLAKDLRSVSVRADLAPLQQAAAARRESTCQDLARELTILRRAA
ncbi:MAG: helix-turn-helix transcriptional regulator [Pseudonocardiales bacterium]|nr:helix-turn-helix transcriptional regulator [Pseudonocardiales bacterium]